MKVEGGCKEESKWWKVKMKILKGMNGKNESKMMKLKF